MWVDLLDPVPPFDLLSLSFFPFFQAGLGVSVSVRGGSFLFLVLLVVGRWAHRESGGFWHLGGFFFGGGGGGGCE